MRKHTLTLLLSLIAFNIYAQPLNLHWLKSYGGPLHVSSQSSDIDELGNVYITGYYEFTADFDPGPDLLNLTSNGNADGYVMKLDPEGNLLWANSFGGNDGDLGTSIHTDSDGNVFVIGHFYSDSVDFDPGPGIMELSSNGSSDIFILKLDSNGDFLWVKQIGGSNYDSMKDCVIDESGNIYLTGSFSDTLDFDPGPGMMSLTANGSEIFVLKLDPEGNLVWVKTMGGAFSEIGRSITLNSSGEILVTGTYTSDTVDFDPGPGTMELFSSNGDWQIFVLKLDSEGDFIWAKSIDGTSKRNWTNGIITDSFDNIVLTGTYQYATDFDPDSSVFELTSVSRDVFLVKLNTDGNLLWAKSYGGNSYDYGRSLSTDDLGNIYVTGNFHSDTIDFDPGPGTAELVYYGGPVTVAGIPPTIFLQKMNSNGIFQWIFTLGGRAYASQVSTDSNGNVYINGGFSNSIFYIPDSAETLLTPLGESDSYILKLSQEGFPSTICYEAIEDLNSTLNPSGTVVALEWGPVFGAMAYQIKGKKAESPGYASTVTSNSYKNIGGLEPGFNYEWKVRAACSDSSISPFSDPDYFSTPAEKSGKIEQLLDVDLSPIPTNDYITLNFNMGISGEYILAIYALDGSCSLKKKQYLATGAHSLNFSVSHLNPGYYLLELTGDRIKTTKEFSIVR